MGPYSPYVPLPSNDTASTGALTIQSGSHLYFVPYGVLAVYDSAAMQNNSFVTLGSGTVIFKKNIRFVNGGIFYADSGNIIFEGGTWTNNSGSTFSAGTSTVTFDGDSDQNFIVNGGLHFTFYNVVVNTQGTVNIQGNVTVSNDCYLAVGCTLNVGTGSSFQVNGTLSGGGTITGSGFYSSLPIELTSFTAVSQSTDALLRWTTATEVDNFGFEIERRSMNPASSNYSSVGFVRGYGTSSSPQEYSYTDRDLPAGRYAYRLKQMDKNGSSRYFTASELTIRAAFYEFSLGTNYPNPFNPSTTIEFTVPAEGRATLKVFNLIGQEVATLFDNEASVGQVHQVHFSASDLPSGLYFYKLQFRNQSVVRRMSLIK